MYTDAINYTQAQKEKVSHSIIVHVINGINHYENISFTLKHDW